MPQTDDQVMKAEDLVGPGASEACRLVIQSILDRSRLHTSVGALAETTGLAPATIVEAVEEYYWGYVLKDDGPMANWEAGIDGE